MLDAEKGGVIVFSGKTVVRAVQEGDVWTYTKTGKPKAKMFEFKGIPGTPSRVKDCTTFVFVKGTPSRYPYLDLTFVGRPCLIRHCISDKDNKEKEIKAAEKEQALSIILEKTPDFTKELTDEVKKEALEIYKEYVEQLQDQDNTTSEGKGDVTKKNEGAEGAEEEKGEGNATAAEAQGGEAVEGGNATTSAEEID